MIAKGGGFEWQFRCGDAPRTRAVVMVPPGPGAETIAKERRVRIQAAVSRLVKAGRDEEALVALRQMAAARNQRDFAGAEKAALVMAATAPEPVDAGPVTFRHVAEMWLSGALRLQDKDAVAEKGVDSVANTRGLMNVILPILGDLPIKSITVEDCDKVKRAIAQKDIGLAQRKKYCRTVRQVFKLATEPLRLIPQPPMSEDWIPKGSEPRRAFQMLFPHEDRVFLASEADFSVRFYIGLLLRTAMRPGEGARLQWRDWSSTIGKINLDETKTKTPRSFFVTDDVAATLDAMRPEDAQPDDYVFPAILKNLAHVVDEIYHPALRLAGLDKLRPELFTNKGARRHITVHDCRGAYVALQTALGATEREIMAVTGHMTSKEITTYQREATELQKMVKQGRLEWYGPLDELLGLRAEAARGAGGVAHGVARVIDLHAKKGPRRSSARTSEGHFPQSDTPNSREKAPSNSRNRGAVPPETGGVAQAGGDAAAGLTAAIASAAAAGKWAVVERLTTQLERLTADAEAAQG